MDDAHGVVYGGVRHVLIDPVVHPRLAIALDQQPEFIPVVIVRLDREGRGDRHMADPSERWPLRVPPRNLIPLVLLTSQRAVMGRLVNARVTNVLAGLATTVISALDGYLLVDTLPTAIAA